MHAKSEDKIEFLKNLEKQDFLDIGLEQVAYIKKIKNAPTEQNSFSIYGADGSQISIMDSYDTAVAAVRTNNLHPVTLH